MSVLAFVENHDGKFKKSAFEVLSHSSEIASKSGVPVIAVCFGKISTEELEKLKNFGTNKVLNVNSVDTNQFMSQPYAGVMYTAAVQENAKFVVLANTYSGKSLAPRLAVKLKAGLIAGANGDFRNDEDGGFIFKKNAFSGKAFAEIKINTPVGIIALSPNAVKLKENPSTNMEVLDFKPQLQASDFLVKSIGIKRAEGKIPLPEAELVVSAGRGMKGPENWKMIEDLATELGAGTACSKPVSDAGWRPHEEHVGQTGIAISPNLYIAVGISGAIQHLAGVSSSKVIVVINKDPEAPFFKAADYGIVGDAFEVVPKLIQAAKNFKNHQ
jgi:electron transfer flavoprotein alpha subunit